MLLKWYDQIDRDCPENMKAVIFNKANNHEVIALMKFSVWAAYQRPCTPQVIPGESIQAAKLLEDLEHVLTIGVHTDLIQSPGAPVLYYSVGDEEDLKVFAIVTGETWIGMVQHDRIPTGKTELPATHVVCETSTV